MIVSMNTKTLIVPFGLAVLTACAQAPHAETAAPMVAGGPVKVAPAKTVATPAQVLTESMLYELLLGEIAGQRGEDALAAEAYTDLALKTRDTRVVKRAIELTVKARKLDDAQRMAHLWVELEPDSFKARQLLIPLLIGQGGFAEAKPHLKALLAMKDRPAAINFLHMQSLLGRYQDKAAGLELVREMASGFADLPEAHYAVAQAAWQANQHDLASRSLDSALRLKPDWESAALFRGQLHQRQGDDAMLAYLQGFLATNPSAGEVRMAYAKALAKAGKYQQARDEFGKLSNAKGNQAEVAYAIGLLSLQVDDLDGAEGSFKQALKLGYNDADTLRLYLAQVSEMRKNYPEALERYDQIDEGERYLEARLKGVVLLGKLKRVVEGRARLAALTPADDREKVRIIQAEAQMLRESGDWNGAFDTLDRAVKAMPDSDDLLYDRAMAAEKNNRLDLMEADLRRLIENDPNHAHAYNALGYTLADRTTRVDEALQLLDKALSLSPDDPFILDSMGWALFRANRLEEAEGYLRRAFAGRADPEIAAHLGEVLWHRGLRDEARKLFSEVAGQHPDNDVLRETITRLKP
jgi:tetratricopeptide (TPR) repeat protein